MATPEAVAATPPVPPATATKVDASGLAIQDRDVDASTLTPLTPEVISRQATINVGTIGHVAHGKSTVVKALSSVKTVKFKDELVRNITIKLGYANAKIYESDGDEPHVFRSCKSSTPDEFPLEDGSGRTMRLVRHVSFVDCPGHDILMATMLNGAAVMDAAMLLVAANEPCPQPQTSEHLAAVEIMQLRHIIILQNKIDLIRKDQARIQQQQIKKFVAGTVANSAPIIPVCAQMQYNIDKVAEYLASHIPIPIRNFTASPRLIIIRSFDVNKPGIDARDLTGGVAGGSILEGVLRIGEEIEVRPGPNEKDADGNIVCYPYTSRVESLLAEKNHLQFAVPGGLIGVGTRMDPTLTRADNLVGMVLGHRGKLPDVFASVEVSFYLLRRLLGVRTDSGRGAKVGRLTKGEVLMVNIGSTSSGGRVKAVKADAAYIELYKPVCTTSGEKVAFSRRVGKNWRLIGWGTINSGKKVDIKYRETPRGGGGGGGGGGGAGGK